jgi:hypothetical protein
LLPVYPALQLQALREREGKERDLYWINSKESPLDGGGALRMRAECLRI